MRAVDRTFKVSVSNEKAWHFLANIESWPNWATHIKKVETTTPGKLTANTRGKLSLSNGIKSQFAMTELNEGKNWKWHGKFLWFDVDFDHIFTPIGDQASEVRWTVDVSGPGVYLLGKIYGKIYNRNLDSAIPNLQTLFKAISRGMINE